MKKKTSHDSIYFVSWIINWIAALSIFLCVFFLEYTAHINSKAVFWEYTLK